MFRYFVVPAHLARTASVQRRRGSGRSAAASVPAGRLEALQAMADRSSGVAALAATSGRIAPGAQPIQMVKDVCDKAHYTNPQGYLASKFPGATIVEDGGSAGVTSGPFQTFARGLAREKVRDKFFTWLDKRMTAINEATGGKPLGRDYTEMQNLIEISQALAKVEDFETALRFLRENSKRMDDVGKPIAIIQQAGNDGAETHAYHYDSGFVQLGPDEFGTNATARARAAMLNGPFGTGWVQGHGSITNWSHRFVEHVHVDKKTGEAFEIYNGDESRVEAARAFGESNKDALTASGPEHQAMEDAFKAKKDADLIAAANPQ